MLGLTGDRRASCGVEEIAVYLVGARRMAVLNERFLGHTGPTDVITFDYSGLPGPERSERGRRALQRHLHLPEVARSGAGFGTS
jgi:ssRNA-specific RNase YbeY (16S rRNA maturation enzyme)